MIMFHQFNVFYSVESINYCLYSSIHFSKVRIHNPRLLCWFFDKNAKTHNNVGAYNPDLPLNMLTFLIIMSLSTGTLVFKKKLLKN